MQRHVEAMLALQEPGAVVFDYGNNLRGQAPRRRADRRVRLSRLRARLHPPAVLRGQGPVPLGRALRRPADIAAPTAVLEPVPETSTLAAGSAGREKVALPGPAGADLLARYGERAEIGLALNELVANGKVERPIVIGRDHLDTGSVASPNRETEAMKDGSDAIADWPILNALLNTACGASWVSIHHGGGVGIGNSLHAGW
jgi:urocanate hydratase